ncbi:MAG: tail fiber protein [Rickettsiales bacterium]
MATLERKHQKIFAGNANNNGQFGSLQATTKVKSQDLDVLQALTAFVNGWTDAVISGRQLPALEEFQALNYINTYQLSYLFQEGIPEWDVETEYRIGSVVKKSEATELYKSKINGNIGNSIPDATSDSNWLYLGDLADLVNINVESAGVIPIGGVISYDGSTEPANWMFCDGRAISRTTYSDLYAAIGTTFGVGDGSTTFNIPDRRGIFDVGKDDMGGTSAGRITSSGGGVDGTVLGETGGSETHTLTESELPSHDHDIGNLILSDTPQLGTGPVKTFLAAGGGQAAAETTGTTGSGDAFSILPPTMVTNKIIRVL